MGIGVRRVASLREAAQLMAADPGARVLAGGTLLVREVNAGERLEGLLMLADGLGLDRIAIAAGRARIGAAVTMAAVAGARELAFLHPVAHSIGGPAVRAMATVGGNLFAPSPYGDFAAALLALDAEVTAEGPDGPEAFPLEELFARQGAERRIVRQIAFRLPPEGSFRYAKVVRRRPHGASVLSIAAVLPVEGGRLARPRIALGAMGPHPLRARAAERALEGRPLAAETIAAAAAAVTDGLSPPTDAFATGWYRMQVLPVHLRRLLQGQ